MTTYWDPMATCGMGNGPRGADTFCCGTTKDEVPCKNFVRKKDRAQGQESLRRLSRRPLDPSNLQGVLADIAKSFLCARWHRERQAEFLGQKWYDTAMGNFAAWGQDLVDAQLPLPVSFDHDAEADLAPDPSVLDRDTSLGSTQDEVVAAALVEPLVANGVSQTMEPYVTAFMLRANCVPWDISPTRPAIMSHVSDNHVGVQRLHLSSFDLSDEISSIYCTFCLAEDEDHVDERVVLRCNGCRSLAHLACVEEWLEKRTAGFSTSCCVCRNEGHLDAVVRTQIVPRIADASEESFASSDHATAASQVSGISPNHEQRLRPTVNARSRPRLVHESAGQGIRRSARLVAQHDASGVLSPAEPRRSLRVASQHRG